jgi:hypothetical protein
MLASASLGKKRKRRLNFLAVPKLIGSQGDQVLEEAASVGKRQKSVMMTVFTCIFVIVSFVFIGYAFFGHFYGWTFIDCFYFAMVTVTTVGYGDLTPEDDPDQQTFVWMYAFAGVVFLGAALGDLVGAISQLVKRMLENAKKKALQKSNEMIAKAMEDNDEVGDVSKSLHDAKEGQLKQIKNAVKHVWEHEGTMVKSFLIFAQLFSVWNFGASLLLAFEEDMSYTQSLYCCVITSLSVGYGDFYPQTQNGRFAFAFFIPFSVVIVIGCIPQLIQLLSDVSSVQVIQYKPMTSILEMDADGDGTISETEYVLFSLLARKDVDKEIVEGLRSQFRAMDADGGGHLTLSDFPTSVCLKRTVTVTNGEMNGLQLEVVQAAEAVQAYAKIGDKFRSTTSLPPPPPTQATRSTKGEGASAKKDLSIFVNPMATREKKIVAEISEQRGEVLVAARKDPRVGAMKVVALVGEAESAGRTEGEGYSQIDVTKGVDLNSVSVDEIGAMNVAEQKFFV